MDGKLCTLPANFSFTKEMVNSDGKPLLDLSGKKVSFYKESKPHRVKISFWSPIEDEGNHWHWNIPITGKYPLEYKSGRPDILYGSLDDTEMENLQELKLDPADPFMVFFIEVDK